MEIGLKEGPLRAAHPQWGPHNKYPHPPVITPENLTNERKEGRTEPFIKLLGHS